MYINGGSYEVKCLDTSLLTQDASSWVSNVSVLSKGQHTFSLPQFVYRTSETPFCNNFAYTITSCDVNSGFTYGSIVNTNEIMFDTSLNTSPDFVAETGDYTCDITVTNA
jgi:hypothetical protein